MSDPNEAAMKRDVAYLTEQQETGAAKIMGRPPIGTPVRKTDGTTGTTTGVYLIDAILVRNDDAKEIGQLASYSWHQLDTLVIL